MNRRILIAGIGLAAAAAGIGVSVPTAVADSASPKTPAVAPVDAGLATSAERLKQLDDLRNAAAANPQRYGGVATAGDAKVTLCDNGAGPDLGSDTAVAALRASGASVTVTSCRHNLADLNSVLAAVAASNVFSDNHVTLKRWGIDYDRNAVEVGVDSIPDGFATKLTALWGDAVHVSVAPNLHLQAGSRTADFPPFFGGDLISSGGGCTSGFTLTNLYGTHYAITAGHCFPLGASVASGGYTMGQVNFRTLGGGNNDAELIGGSSYAGKVWMGGAGAAGNTWLPVHRTQNSCNGCLVDENGEVTGESVVRLAGYPYCDNLGGLISCNVQDAYAVSGPGCQDGDSGNPVLAFDGQGGLIAVGIHHAGDGYGYCAYTQLPPILSQWTSTVTTS